MDETRVNWSNAIKEWKTFGKGWNCWGPRYSALLVLRESLRVQGKAWSQDAWMECVAAPTLWMLEAGAPPVWPSWALRPSQNCCQSHCSPAWPILALGHAHVMHTCIPAHPSPSSSHRAQEMGISPALHHACCTGPAHHNGAFTMTKGEMEQFEY